jgi:hypothetical protein
LVGDAEDGRLFTIIAIAQTAAPMSLPTSRKETLIRDRKKSQAG